MLMCTLEAELKLKSYITYVTYSIWRNRQYIIRRIYRSGAPAQILSHQSHTTEDGASNRLNQGHCLNYFAFYSASICDVLFYCYSVTYHSLTSMFVSQWIRDYLHTCSPSILLDRGFQFSVVVKSFGRMTFFYRTILAAMRNLFRHYLYCFGKISPSRSKWRKRGAWVCDKCPANEICDASFAKNSSLFVFVLSLYIL